VVPFQYVIYKGQLTTKLTTQSQNQACLFHELLNERSVEVAADRVVDEALLLLRLIPGLVSEHHVVVPSPLDLLLSEHMQVTHRTNSLCNLSMNTQLQRINKEIASNKPPYRALLTLAEFSSMSAKGLFFMAFSRLSRSSSSLSSAARRCAACSRSSLMRCSSACSSASSSSSSSDSSLFGK